MISDYQKTIKESLYATLWEYTIAFGGDLIFDAFVIKDNEKQ